MNENIMPHNPEAEIKTLGAMLRSKEATAHVLSMLDVEDFYELKSQAVFEAIRDCSSRGIYEDLTSVADAIQKTGSMDEVTTASYLIEIVGSVATAASVAHHAAIVLEKATRRRIIRNASQQAQEAVNGDLDVIASTAYQNALSIIPDSKVSGFRRIDRFLDRTIETIEERMKRRSSGRAFKDIQTGLLDFDRRFGGLNRGELAILAARPSEGKTLLASQVALNVAEGGNVAYVSLEMDGSEILSRTLSSYRGKDDSETARLILRRADELQKLHLYFDDGPAIKIDQLAARCERLKIEIGRLALLVIDYLQLLRCPGDMNRLSRYEKITYLSGECKALARRLDCPVLLLSQLSRDCDKEARPPRLSDLRESGSIEQDADLVCFIHRPQGVERGASGIRELMIEKNRSGPTGSIRMIFDSENLNFHCLSDRGAPDEVPEW